MAHVVVHRIFSLSVSLPVRGADGLAKRAPYGGVERQRLSSQSVKSHLRATTGIPGSMADLAAALGTEMSVRSALIGPRLIAPELEKRGLSAEVASDWAGAVMALFQSGKKAPPPEAASAFSFLPFLGEAEARDPGNRCSHNCRHDPTEGTDCAVRNAGSRGEAVKAEKVFGEGTKCARRTR